jgi:hypothetical protein
VRSVYNKEISFYANNDDPYFTYGKAGETRISAYELDDYVLGPLEDIASLNREGLVNARMMYDVFSWYVVTLWEDSAVKEYIAWERAKPNGSDFYEGLEGLYKKFKKRLAN